MFITNTFIYRNVHVFSLVLLRYFKFFVWNLIFAISVGRGPCAWCLVVSPRLPQITATYQTADLPLLQRWRSLNLIHFPVFHPSLTAWGPPGPKTLHFFVWRWYLPSWSNTPSVSVLVGGGRIDPADVKTKIWPPRDKKRKKF
jgi:hypothetical protein